MMTIIVAKPPYRRMDSDDESMRNANRLKMRFWTRAVQGHRTNNALGPRLSEG